MKYKIIVLLLIFLLGMYMDKIYNEEESNNKIEIEDVGEEYTERLKKEITEFLSFGWYEV